MTKHRDRGDEICDYIERYSKLHGYPPTVREVTRASGLASTGATFHWLQKLVVDGRIRMTPRTSRSLVVLHE